MQILQLQSSDIAEAMGWNFDKPTFEQKNYLVMVADYPFRGRTKKMQKSINIINRCAAMVCLLISACNGDTTENSPADTEPQETAAPDAGTDGATDEDTATTVCGDTPVDSGKYTIDVEGEEREFILTLPDDYDNTKAYPLVLAWHGWTDSADNTEAGGYFGLLPASDNQAIFVAGQGLDALGVGPGWENKDGRDVAFVETLLAWLRRSVCYDEARVFSVGFSYGGMFSNLLACELGSVFRAIAPVAGSFMHIGVTEPDTQCVGEKVAAFYVHATNDAVVSYESGEEARDYFLGINGCDDSTTEVTPEGCVRYDGCDDAYPIVWCTHEGNHSVPSFVGEGAWEFFSQF
jgi:poly(3-hydroxybutyrate) depolymerase